MLTDRIIQLTVPCEDDGYVFRRTERLELIQNTLRHTRYELMCDMPLAKVYAHEDFYPTRPSILVSCHIDSLYGTYFADIDEYEIRGTFDNSACNAIAIEIMCRHALASQILVTFTGDEEDQSRGADQAVEGLQGIGAYDHLEMVITLDLTEACYPSRHFTIENYFIEQQHIQKSLLRFNRKIELKRYLESMIESPLFIRDAEPDESWQYDEHDLNCFSLCLPCRVLGRDMHDDAGVAVTTDTLAGYMSALKKLTRNINTDLATRIHR